MNKLGISGRNMVFGLAAVVTASTLSAQDPAKVHPRSYRVLLENSEVRVLEYSSVPGMGVCGAGVHSHPRALNILLTPARVRVTAKGKTFIATNKEGDVWYTPAVTHEAENISGHGVRSVMVEFKTPRPR
jgi:hypothetical protein